MATGQSPQSAPDAPQCLVIRAYHPHLWNHRSSMPSKDSRNLPRAHPRRGQESTPCRNARRISRTTASSATQFLGPKVASESGKPSAEAKRFINETTSTDRPRVYRNAIVLAVPSRDGLDAVRTRVREYLGWIEVRDQLRGQPIDPIREQMLAMR